MRLILALAVFALDLWALVSILGARASAKTKVAWMFAVVALPLAGVVWWWRAGPKAVTWEASKHDPDPDPRS
jgi:hypothetical protein